MRHTILNRDSQRNMLLSTVQQMLQILPNRASLCIQHVSGGERLEVDTIVSNFNGFCRVSKLTRAEARYRAVLSVSQSLQG